MKKLQDWSNGQRAFAIVVVTISSWLLSAMIFHCEAIKRITGKMFVFIAFFLFILFFIVLAVFRRYFPCNTDKLDLIPKDEIRLVD